jgi:hypothetical protein
MRTVVHSATMAMSLNTPKYVRRIRGKLLQVRRALRIPLRPGTLRLARAKCPRHLHHDDDTAFCGDIEEGAIDGRVSCSESWRASRRRSCRRNINYNCDVLPSAWNAGWPHSPRNDLTINFRGQVRGFVNVSVIVDIRLRV